MSSIVITPASVQYESHITFVFHSWTYENFLEIDMLTIVSGFLSLLGTCLSLYWLFKMDPSHYRYRHKLYMYLMITDWVRAMAHVIYPALSLHALVSQNYESKYFTLDHFDACDFFGFLTNTAFMSSDVVITMIALHTIMTIKEASQNQKHHIYKKSKHKFSFKRLIQPSIEQNLDDEKISLITENHGYLETKDFVYKQESGLYSYDFFLLTCLIICVPIFLCAISYIGGYKMQNYFAFCYPALFPTWRRVVSAWLLRFIALVIIFFSYFGIYIYISFKFRQLTKEHERLVKALNLSKYSTNISAQSINRVANWLYVLKSGLYNSLFNVEMKDEDSILNSDSSSSSISFHSISRTFTSTSRNITVPEAVAIRYDKRSSSGKLEVIRDPCPIPANNQLEQATRQITTDMFQKSLEDFKIRKKQSLKSLKFIFVYPASYVFIWTVPFIGQCFCFSGKPPPYALSACISLFQAIDGFLQTLIFAYRERPWRWSVKSKPVATTTTTTINRPATVTQIPLRGVNFGECLPDQNLENSHSSKNTSSCFNDSNGFNSNPSINGKNLSSTSYHVCGKGVQDCSPNSVSRCNKLIEGSDIRQNEEIGFFDALNAPRL